MRFRPPHRAASAASLFVLMALGAALAQAQSYPTRPVRLIIPSIKLDAPITPVGTNAKGEMDVPSGKTKNVGWYKDGTVPGENGTAVIDAHVFAAFSKLKNLKAGSDIYVVTATNERVHFVVGGAKTFTLNAITSRDLFGSDGAARLNLITCAGSLTKSKTTYEHRLVVYAVKTA